MEGVPGGVALPVPVADQAGGVGAGQGGALGPGEAEGRGGEGEVQPGQPPPGQEAAQPRPRLALPAQQGGVAAVPQGDGGGRVLALPLGRVSGLRCSELSTVLLARLTCVATRPCPRRGGEGQAASVVQIWVKYANMKLLADR